MPYNSLIPAEGNAVRAVSGDLVLMRANFLVLASLVSGLSAPAAGDPATGFVVTSGAHTLGFSFNGVSGEVEYDGSPVLTTTGDEMLFSVPAGGSSAPTDDSHYVRRSDTKVETIGGHIVTLASGSVFALEERAMYGYTIEELHAQTASGTIDVTVKIGATPVTGLSGVTISGTQSSDTASAAKTVTSGARVTMELGADVGTPSDLSFTIKTIRS